MGVVLLLMNSSCTHFKVTLLSPSLPKNHCPVIMHDSFLELQNVNFGLAIELLLDILNDTIFRHAGSGISHLADNPPYDGQLVNQRQGGQNQNFGQGTPNRVDNCANCQNCSRLKSAENQGKI